MKNETSTQQVHLNIDNDNTLPTYDAALGAQTPGSKYIYHLFLMTSFHLI